MKSIIFIFLGVFILFPSVLNAAQDTDYFSVQTGPIVTYTDHNITQFDVLVEQDTSLTLPIISYWKVRLYCDEGVLVGVNSFKTNHCQQALRIDNSDLSKFSLYFKNENEHTSRFTYKLKAYDANGDWLDTQTQAFSWK